jgi:hypothetical protein
MKEDAMADKFSPDDIKNLWQNQETEHVPMSLDDIYRKAQKLEKKVAQRNVIGPALCLVEIVAFGFFMFRFPNVMQRIGSALTIGGMLYWIYQIYMKRTGDMPFGMGREPCFNFLRRELERQREFHDGLSFWLRVITVIPGPVLFSIGFVMADPGVRGQILLFMAFFIALIILAVPLNRREARKYQRQIDELDRLAK